MQRVIGMDIGGTKCAVLLAEVGTDIEIKDKIRFPTCCDNGFEYTKGKLFDAVHILMRRSGLEQGDIAAIGVSCGGPLDSEAGIIGCPPNLPGWVDVPIVRMLWEEFGIPAWLQNDAKACALVEWMLGAGKGARDMVFLTMGTGMGGGIIANGALLTGTSGMGGEVGHIRLESDGPVGFGKAGSFEGFCSGGGIARFARSAACRALEAGTPFAFGQSKAAIEALETHDLAQHARCGDTDAIALFEAVGEKLGRGIAYLVDILNPEVVVIGSIFARCEELLRPTMEKALCTECIPHSLGACRVVPAATGEGIGDLAAVMTAVHGQGLRLETPCIPDVSAHFDALFQRYPALVPVKGDIWKAYVLIRDSYVRQGKLLCCGNGGSAADADHIVGELMKGFYLGRRVGTHWQADAHITGEDVDFLSHHLQGALPALALTQHPALLSAFCNDVSPEMVFAQQVYGHGKKGDVLLAISTSGQSANVVRAAQVARLSGLYTIGLTGETQSPLAQLCDVCIRVPGRFTAEVQELHLPVYHTICAMLEATLFE